MYTLVLRHKRHINKTCWGHAQKHLRIRRFFWGFPLLHAVGWNFHFSMAPKSATAPKSAKTDATALAQALSILWVPWSWMKFACGACWMKQCRGTVGRWLLKRDCPEFQQGTPVCFTFSPDFGPRMFSFLGRRFPPTIRCLSGEVGAAQQAGNLMLECFGRSDAPGVEAAQQRCG